MPLYLSVGAGPFRWVRRLRRRRSSGSLVGMVLAALAQLAYQKLDALYARRPVLAVVLILTAALMLILTAALVLI